MLNVFLFLKLTKMTTENRRLEEEMQALMIKCQENEVMDTCTRHVIRASIRGAGEKAMLGICREGILKSTVYIELIFCVVEHKRMRGMFRI